MIYPAVYDMTIEQRARFERGFRLLDKNSAPMDLTGYTLVASLWTETRKKLLDFTFTWLDQIGGSFALTLTPAQTTGLQGAAMWDLLVTDADGNKDYFMRGRVLIEQGFTV